MYDFHIHNNFSNSEESLDSLVVASIYKNLDTICFIEKFPRQTIDNLISDTSLFFNEIQRVKYQYSQSINILAGIELNADLSMVNLYSEFIEDNFFDFIVLSYKSNTFRHASNKEEALKIIRSYYSHLLDFLKIYNDFDALSHLDHIDKILVKNNITIDYRDYRDLILPILDLLVKNNKALEVSTAGLRCRIYKPFPKAEILKDFKKLGGSLITVGSNAIKDDNLAFEFDKVKNYIYSLGFNQLYYFDDRQILPINE